jgi:hypothetical protein
MAENPPKLPATRPGSGSRPRQHCPASHAAFPIPPRSPRDTPDTAYKYTPEHPTRRRPSTDAECLFA